MCAAGNEKESGVRSLRQGSRPRKGGHARSPVRGFIGTDEVTMPLCIDNHVVPIPQAMFQQQKENLCVVITVPGYLVAR